MVAGPAVAQVAMAGEGKASPEWNPGEPSCPPIRAEAKFRGPTAPGVPGCGRAVGVGAFVLLERAAGVRPERAAGVQKDGKEQARRRCCGEGDETP